MKKFLILVILIILLSACSENYSNGERIGVVTKFSKAGLLWKSWEGHLNITQTGMNSAGEPFEFSIDNDNENPDIINLLDKAANKGHKVKIIYHQVVGWNWLGNRGETDYFVKRVILIDTNFTTPNTSSIQYQPGKIIDTIYVIIDKSKEANPSE